MRLYDRFWVDLGRVAVITLALVILFVVTAWIYTSAKLTEASSNGIYTSAEEGMRSQIKDYYKGVHRSQILYAGPNYRDDRNTSHVWYVVALIHADSFADGRDLGHGGCDAPGSFFLQTKAGWVQISEGAFPGLIGSWMKLFGMAGDGLVTPSTDNMPDGKLCP